MCANKRMLEIAAGMFLAGAALPPETDRVSLNLSGAQASDILKEVEERLKERP